MDNDIVTLCISDFIIEQELQLRDKIDEKVIKDYMTAYKNCVDMPPIEVAKVKGCLYLIAGFHRVEALKRLEVRTVKAKVIKAKSMKEAKWLAGKSNITHGKRLTTNAEKRRLFDAYIKAGQWKTEYHIKSSMEMAQDIGIISNKSVQRWLKKYHWEIWREVWNSHYKGNEEFDPSSNPPHDEKEAHTEVRRSRETLDSLKACYMLYPTHCSRQQKKILKAVKGMLKGIEEYHKGCLPIMPEVKVFELTEHEGRLMKDEIKSTHQYKDDGEHAHKEDNGDGDTDF